jgi:TPR repeat protein
VDANTDEVAVLRFLIDIESNVTVTPDGALTKCSSARPAARGQRRSKCTTAFRTDRGSLLARKPDRNDRPSLSNDARAEESSVIRCTMIALLLTAGMAGAASANDARDCGSSVVTALDPARVVAACLRLADQGQAWAEYNLAVVYSSDSYVREFGAKSNAEIAAWYKKAAEQGFALAQLELGEICLTGRGLPKNDAESIKWFRKAAEQGVISAQMEVGTAYSTGWSGYPKDDVQAYFWLYLAESRSASIAASHPSSEIADTSAGLAQEALDLVAKRMTPDEIAEAKRLAAQWKPQADP